MTTEKGGWTLMAAFHVPKGGIPPKSSNKIPVSLKDNAYFIPKDHNFKKQQIHEVRFFIHLECSA